MNKENFNPDPGSAEAGDARLSALLHESRVSPALPPRFQEGVWRRIEEADVPVQSTGGIAWLDALAALVLRPRFALVTASMLVMAGALIGVRAGDHLAQQDAQAQYITAVAPAAMR